MTKPTTYADAARGLLGAFTGRNNDVDGYWALGKLYTHALLRGVHRIEVDAMQSTLTPQNAEFDGMLAWLRRKLDHQLAARSISPAEVVAMGIVLGFTGKRSDGPWGDVFECVATLVDHLCRAHHATAKGACWPHDPFHERRRAMPYGGA